MSAFSLVYSPQTFPRLLHPSRQRSPTQPAKKTDCRVFGGVLEPRYIVGAEPLDQ